MIRTIVSRSDIDMTDISNEYERLYNQSLEDAIEVLYNLFSYFSYSHRRFFRNTAPAHSEMVSFVWFYADNLLNVNLWPVMLYEKDDDSDNDIIN
jgi:hypothetical protein